MHKAFLCILSICLLQTTQVYAKTCYSFFSKKITVPYDQVYAGQEVVGIDYALYKELESAGLDPKLQWNQLNGKKTKKLLQSVLLDLEDDVPAVRDPYGRIFLLDGHHQIYVGAQIYRPLSQLPIKVKILYDSLSTKVSMDDFVTLAIERHWFYKPTALPILLHPKKVHQLRNSTERSMMGLVFLAIEKKYSVPMKGKHFSPFVQFYLIDLILEKKILEFPEKTNFDDVERIQNTLLASPHAIRFWLAALKPEAPQSLRAFLEERLSAAAH